MKANSEKTKQSKKATRRVLAGVLCGASVLSLVLSLVMPPISQAIANDAQTVSTEKTVMGGGSSSESTDVGNTNNGDTENLNSDDAEGDEADSSNAVEQGQPENQPEDKLQAEDSEPADDVAVALAAEGGQTETASDKIDSAEKLKSELEKASGAANFKLVKDIDTSSTIQLSKADSNITLDLNGCKIKHKSENQPLFNITGGATLTIKDTDPKKASESVSEVEKLNDQGQNLNPDNYSKKAVLSYNNGIPSNLTYYVTQSSPSATDITKTTETLSKHSVEIKGAIVACGGSERLKLINLYATDGKGGTFKLESGVITQQQNTQQQNSKVSSLVYAENGSIVNMSGGYVCGASTGTSGTGAGIMVSNAGGNGSTLNLIGGVIADNYAPNGGGVYANGSIINMTGGAISGNGTFEDQAGYGAGICALGSAVTVSGGYITNNKNQYDYEVKEGTNSTHKGNGCHGGGGIAAYNGGSLVISGGCITGNYSAEAGGGVYAGYWTKPLNSFKVCGGIIASNVAKLSEGGGIRIAAPTVGEFEAGSGSKVYITNNTTNTTNDWGGGGVFVQGGNADQNVNSASLKIYNALITNNHANGFGGGFAACPTGKTAITDTNGIAIFGNSDGNSDGSYNRSGGTNGKSEDWDFNKEDDKGGEITPAFIGAGHKDLFLIHDSNNFETNPYIAAVTGQMLGGGAANWSGTIDKNTPTSIGKYEGAQAKYLIGLKSDPIKEDKDAATAAATLYITGNKSNIHGGGIMTNGDVIAGSTTEVKVYPKMKLSGTKQLTGRALEAGEFKFQLLKPGKDGKAPSFNDGKLQLNDCSVVDTVENDKKGNFTFNLSEVYADNDLVYYLVEVPGADKDVNYDKTIYKIDPKVVKDEDKSHNVLGIEYTYYTVSSVQITTIAANGVTSDATVNPTTEGDVASVALTTNSTTFTNAYTKYDSMGSWTPKATKVVEGGEMKEFTLEFADNENFEGNSVRTVKTDAAGDTTQTLSFLNASDEGIKYSLSDITKEPYTHGDSTGRGASKTFTYYVHEKTDGASFSNYKYDKSVYKLDVTMTDQTNGEITATKVTYTQIKDVEGVRIEKANPVNYNDGSDNTKPVSTPTFTNTYSTSLPLSGMSGVTLTYLAGAAVLCAAAAWMHIRRKANAKGGERRE